jgi:hypothetical protein
LILKVTDEALKSVLAQSIMQANGVEQILPRTINRRESRFVKGRHSAGEMENSMSRKQGSAVSTGFLLPCGIFLITVALAALSACSSSKSTTAPVIAVQFDKGALPPTTIELGTTAQIAAYVTNDANNEGVSWSCVPTGSCGSFSPSQTASGEATTYMAPSATGSVTITATSDADSTISVSATINVILPIVVKLTQAPPLGLGLGAKAPITATLANDTADAGATWSCSPAGSCGSFSPGTTLSGIGTTYTAPTTIPPSGNVTITATSVTENTSSASALVRITTLTVATLRGQYAFVQQSYGSWGIVGSVTLDGKGKVTGGKADASANGQYYSVTIPSGTYTLDATGHGEMVMNMTFSGGTCAPGCVGTTLTQTNSITYTSSSHLLIAEIDENVGFTVGGVGSMDLQSAGPSFAASQVKGGYSFTLAGYSGTEGANGSWGGIFTADGKGKISAGTFDENVGAGAPAAGTSFTGTFTPPDTNGRGIMTLTATPDNPTPAAGSSPQYVYYIVTPEVLRLTSMDVSHAGNTGTAFGQGSVVATTAALNGNFVFSYFGFGSDINGGESSAAAGQFTADGRGDITGGLMDLNVVGTVTLGTSLAGSTYSFGTAPGSPRGQIIVPNTLQTYNIYLTDPNLNLLDPNNTTGGGGALLLESDTTGADAIGVVIPQTPASATFAGSDAVFLSDQSAPPNSDGGFSGDFTVTSETLSGTFVGEGDWDTKSLNGPLSGGFTADEFNPGHFSGQITTTPAFPLGTPGGSTPGTEQVDFFLANGLQGFIVETDSIAPVFGVLELQEPSQVQDPPAVKRTSGEGDPANHSLNPAGVANGKSFTASIQRGIP